MLSRIGLAALSSLLVVYSLRAEPASEELAPVVVSATRLADVEVSPDRVPSKVTVITAQDIERTGARTVQEALQHLGGVVLYDQVGNAFQTTFEMRGFNGMPVSATSVFVDGVRANETSFNTINFDLIPIEAIERIEVIPGSSATFGKNALGGVLNIVTKRGGEESLTTIEAAGGSYGRQRYTASTGGPMGKPVDYFFSAARELEDGYRDDSGARISRFLGKFGWQPFDGMDVTLAYTHVNDRLSQAGSLPQSFADDNPRQNITPGDFADSRSHALTLNAKNELGAGFSLATNLFYRKIDRDSFVNGVTSDDTRTAEVENPGTALQLSHEGECVGHANLLSLGFEYAYTRFDSQSESDFGFGPFPADRVSDENAISVYLQDSFDVTSQITLTGGVRYDHDNLDFRDRLDATNQQNKTFERFTPRAGITYQAMEQLSLYFNYSQGFRPPTEQELFVFVGFSNPDLRPVKTQNYEIGAKARLQPWLDGSLALFQIDSEDEITFNPSIPPFGLNDNLGDIRRRGVEVSFLARYQEWLDGSINYSFTEAEFDESFAAFSGTGGLVTVEEGDRVPLVPTHRLGLGAAVHPIQGLTVAINGLYQSSQFLVGDESNDQATLSSYFVLNAKVSYERDMGPGRLKCFLSANNVLDREYSTFGVYSGFAAATLGTPADEPFVIPAPEFNIFGGIAYEF